MVGGSVGKLFKIVTKSESVVPGCWKLGVGFVGVDGCESRFRRISKLSRRRRCWCPHHRRVCDKNINHHQSSSLCRMKWKKFYDLSFIFFGNLLTLL